MARLGRETQLHLDERHRHFRITDAVIILISLVLVVLAIFNIYYVRVVYTDLDGIVSNMDSMYLNLRRVDKDMTVITDRLERVNGHVEHMESIDGQVSQMSTHLPEIREDMTSIDGSMTRIEQDMGLLGQGMGSIDQRMQQMSNTVGVMRENVRQMARPMSTMNPFLP
jgi:methyl-accepting chemotaxis protein